MNNLRRDLQAVNRELKALTKKVEKLIAAAAKTEKPKPVKRTATAGGAARKAVKRTPVRKQGKAPARKPATKKAKRVTGIDTVIGIITRSRKGVGVADLREKTGYNARKIYATVKALKKKGAIKTAGRGLYVRA